MTTPPPTSSRQRMTLPATQPEKAEDMLTLQDLLPPAVDITDIVPDETMWPTLYTPATLNTDKLVTLMNGVNPFVRRLVICTEDSVAERDVKAAIRNVEAALKRFAPSSNCQVFIRARNAKVLTALLQLDGIGKVTGFVIPKAHYDTFPGFAEQIIAHGSDFRLMPIMESQRLPDAAFRSRLRDTFEYEPYKELIDCLRFGANDLMGYQGMRPDRSRLTVYDVVTGNLLAAVLNEFRGLWGFAVTAPVFECFGEDYDKWFRREVRRHIGNELFGQTVIHPRHLPLLFDLYRVKQRRAESAIGIVYSDDAVIGRHGAMDEKYTHGLWAKNTLRRALMFGIKPTTSKKRK